MHYNSTQREDDLKVKKMNIILQEVDRWDDISIQLSDTAHVLLRKLGYDPVTGKPLSPDAEPFTPEKIFDCKDGEALCELRSKKRVEWAENLLKRLARV